MQRCTILLSFLLVILLTSCGLAGTEDQCENPHPSQKEACDTKENTDWDKLTWDEGRWS